MSLRKILGRILFFAVLQVGVVAGLKMTPDEIEKLLNVMTRTRVVHVLKRERDKEE